MKILAYAAPIFSITVLIAAAIIITGCAEKLFPLSGDSSFYTDDNPEREAYDGWTCIGNCTIKGERK